MRRAVHVLMLLLLFGQVGGFYAVAGNDPCFNPCEDDAEGKDCPPACATCSCSVRANGMPTMAGLVAKVPPPTVLETFVQPQRRPDDPGPREILHVPIAHLVSLIG